MNHQFNLYKLKREVLRVGQQMRALAEWFYEPILRIFYEHRRATLLKINHGQFAVVPENIKIALFLIFQPSEIAPSILSTCQYLINNGYAPLIISNAPLSNNAIAQLKSVSWRIVERPNFGYDFGGYRDGLWLLDKWSIKPETLVVLNDSVWFPLNQDDTFLQRMMDKKAAFVGALQLEPVRHWKDRSIKLRKRPFYGSFFLLLKREALEHPAFIRFWREYKITSNKYKTIRRGERNFSHVMFDAGVPSDYMFSRHMFDDRVAVAEPSELLDILRELVTIDTKLDQERLRCIQAYNPNLIWTKHAQQIIYTITEKQNILATAPVSMLQTFKTPYLKKSKDFANQIAIKHLLNKIERNYELGIDPQIVSELQQQVGLSNNECDEPK